MSFTCKGHDTLWVTVDRDMSCIELVDRRGDVAEAFQLRGQPEAEALLAKLKVGFAKCSRERSTNPRAGLPAEFVTFDGATCERLCEALDHFWICGGDGYPREIITRLFDAGLIRIGPDIRPDRPTTLPARSRSDALARCGYYKSIDTIPIPELG